MYDNIFDLVTKVVKAWLNRDGVVTRLFQIVTLLAGLIAITASLIQFDLIQKEVWEPILIAITSILIVSLLVIRSYQTLKDEREVKEEILKVEKEIKSHPDRPTASWDLARLKLESYLNRNLAQVRWIFFWTVMTMIVGFIIIAYGIMKVYDNPDNLNPSVLVTITGIITEIIGGTFLIIYKSTMNQAKEYVDVLERINAVGMSVQILESIDKDSKQLQNETRAEIAKELLKLYGSKVK